MNETTGFTLLFIFAALIPPVIGAAVGYGLSYLWEIPDNPLVVTYIISACVAGAAFGAFWK